MANPFTSTPTTFTRTALNVSHSPNSFSLSRGVFYQNYWYVAGSGKNENSLIGTAPKAKLHRLGENFMDYNCISQFTD